MASLSKSPDVSPDSVFAGSVAALIFEYYWRESTRRIQYAFYSHGKLLFHEADPVYGVLALIKANLRKRDPD